MADGIPTTGGLQPVITSLRPGAPSQAVTPAPAPEPTARGSHPATKVIVKPGERRTGLLNAAKKFSEVARSRHAAVVQRVLDMYRLSPLAETTSRYKTVASIELKLRQKWQPVDHPTRLERADWERILKMVVTDLIGIRVVLPFGDREEIEDMVRQIIWVQLFDEGGKFELLEIENIHGPDTAPYLDDGDRRLLRKALKMSGMKNSRRVIVDSVREMNYTAINLTLAVDGVNVEIQIRGPLIDAVARVEHRHYKARVHRDLAVKKRNKLTHEQREIARAFAQLTPGQMDAYRLYIKSLYACARDIETGRRVTLPSFPDALTDFPVLRIILPSQPFGQL